jgi:hypothetical protein
MIPASFYDELQKIAADPGLSPADVRSMGPDRYQFPPTELPDEDRFITKDRLKRGLIVAGLTGAGGAVGHGGAHLVRKYLTHMDPAQMSKLRHYAPAIVGGLALPLGWMAREQARMSDNYIAYGDKPKTPNA